MRSLLTTALGLGLLLSLAVFHTPSVVQGASLDSWVGGVDVGGCCNTANPPTKACPTHCTGGPYSYCAEPGTGSTKKCKIGGTVSCNGDGCPVAMCCV